MAPLVEEPSTRKTPSPGLPGTPTGSRWDGRLQMRSKQEKCSTMTAELGTPREGVFARRLPTLLWDTGSR